MPVVSKGEFTVSRLDDGRTPYVHTAYSWSADGTDRFTTVYPRENLILGSADFSTGLLSSQSIVIDGTEHGIKNKIVKCTVTTSGLSYFNAWTYRAIGATKAGKYTLMFKAKASANMAALASYFYNPNTTTDMVNSQGKSGTRSDGQSLFNLTTEWQDIWVTWTQSETASAKSIILARCFRGSQDIDFYMTEPILVEGSVVPTIYTPSPSEDYANAYPLYEGTYTDYSDTASQNPSDYTWRRIKGESGQDGVAGADGKGIKSTAVTYQASTSGTTAPIGTWVANPPAVTKGQYLWTRTIWTYTDNATETGYSVAYVAKDGNDGSDGIAGKDGVGIASTVIQYVGSTSGTTKPTAGWTTAIPSVAEGSFLWTKTVWTYSDGTNETGYSVAKMGAKGPTGSKGDTGAQGPKGDTGEQGPPTGVISQNTVPSSPYVGMLWQCTGNIAGYINPATYRWNGSVWEIYQFTAQNILAETFTGFVFQGVEFIGSSFTSNFDYQMVAGSPTWLKGTSVMANGQIKTTTQQYTKSTGVINAHIVSKLDPDALRLSMNGAISGGGVGDSVAETTLSPGSLSLIEKDNDGIAGLDYYRGYLTAKMLTKMPWNNLPLNSGFQASEGRTPQYKIQYNVDGTRTILFRGQVTTTNASIPANCYFEKDREYFCATIPSAVRPAQTCFTYAPTGANVYVGGRLAAIAGSGSIQVLIPHANVNYIVLDSLSYIID